MMSLLRSGCPPHPGRSNFFVRIGTREPAKHNQGKLSSEERPTEPPDVSSCVSLVHFVPLVSRMAGSCNPQSAVYNPKSPHPHNAMINIPANITAAPSTRTPPNFSPRNCQPATAPSTTFISRIAPV